MTVTPNLSLPLRSIAQLHKLWTCEGYNAALELLDTAYGTLSATYLIKANNLSDVASAATSRTNLGLGSIATQAASAVAITGGSVTGITDLAVTDGGTGASTAADARTALGLVIGTNVQAYDADLTTWAGLTPSAYFQTLIDDADAATARATLGLGTLATQSGTFSGTSSGTNTGDQTNITGNAATVTTNANLTGPITSVGNATSIASQTGTGSKFVVDTTPTLVTPVLGAATGTSVALADGAVGTPAFTFSGDLDNGLYRIGANNPGLAAGGVKVIDMKSTGVAVLATTTNDDAAAGFIGEYSEAEVLNASAVSLTTSTTANVTSLSLTAGDWDIWGSVCFKPGSSTSVTVMAGGVHTTSATLPVSPAKGAYFQQFITAKVQAASAGDHYPAGMRRLSLSATTTVYLVAYATFTVSTMGAYGILCARRRR